MLGRAPALYARYAEQVRLEYCHVPHAQFGAGRAAFLEGFLSGSGGRDDDDAAAAAGAAAQQQPLFFTAAARQRYESQARANIQAEIRRLRARPCGTHV